MVHIQKKKKKETNNCWEQGLDEIRLENVKKNFFEADWRGGTRVSLLSVWLKFSIKNFLLGRKSMRINGTICLIWELSPISKNSLQTKLIINTVQGLDESCSFSKKGQSLPQGLASNKNIAHPVLFFISFPQTWRVQEGYLEEGHDT